MEHTGGDHGLPPPPPRKRWKVPASIPGDANVSTEPNDAMESERRGAHSRDDEAHVASAIDIDTTIVLETCAAAPPALQPAAPAPAAASAAGCTVAAARERLKAMFLGAGEKPRRSDIDAVSTTATTAMVVVARDAVSEPDHGFWCVHAVEIKAACAPQSIDEMDVLGYLGADMVGWGLLHADDANGVGKRMQTQATRADAALQAAAKTERGAISKAKQVDVKVQAAVTAGMAAREKVLGKPADLKLE